MHKPAMSLASINMMYNTAHALTNMAWKRNKNIALTFGIANESI